MVLQYKWYQFFKILARFRNYHYDYRFYKPQVLEVVRISIEHRKFQEISMTTQQVESD